jgi:hypothetical protein
MLTFEQACNLKFGDTLIDQYGKRWRVNGQVQRWKTMPNRVRIPLKHGLYVYDSITEVDLPSEFLTKEE